MRRVARERSLAVEVFDIADVDQRLAIDIQRLLEFAKVFVTLRLVASSYSEAAVPLLTTLTGHVVVRQLPRLEPFAARALLVKQEPRL